MPALGPRRALAIALSIALLALAGAAAAVLGGSLAGLLAAQFALGVAARLSQVASTLAGTRGPVAARSEGTASALLTATRQCGSALGVAIVSATLVAVHGSDRPPDGGGDVRDGRLRAGRPAGHPGRAGRAAASPRPAAPPSVPPSRRRDPLTAAAPGAVPGTGDRRRLRLAAGPRLPARPPGSRRAASISTGDRSAEAIDAGQVPREYRVHKAAAQGGGARCRTNSWPHRSPAASPSTAAPAPQENGPAVIAWRQFPDEQHQ